MFFEFPLYILADQEDALSSKAYIFKSSAYDESDSDSETNEIVTGLRIKRDEVDEDWEDSSESDDDDVEQSLSPLPEDTNCKSKFNKPI